MSSLHASMKGNGWKTVEKKWRHRFSHHNPICNHGNQWLDWPNFKLIQALMYVIITCTYEKDPIMKSREKVETVFPIISLWDFFKCSRAANSAVGGPIRLKFELVQALMHVIISCKYVKDRMKNSREKVETPFSQS